MLILCPCLIEICAVFDMQIPLIIIPYLLSLSSTIILFNPYSSNHLFAFSGNDFFQVQKLCPMLSNFYGAGTKFKPNVRISWNTFTIQLSKPSGYKVRIFFLLFLDNVLFNFFFVVVWYIQKFFQPISFNLPSMFWSLILNFS